MRVDELEEENRRKLAEATLVEIELREDFSVSNADFHESLSRLGASSEGKEKARINDWVKNSPSGAQTEMQPSIGARSTIALTDTIKAQATPQSFLVDVIASAPAADQSRIPEVNPTTTTTTQRATIQNQVLLLPPKLPPVLFNPSLTVTVSHILPNMSAWTIPTAINNHSTQPSPHLPSSQQIKRMQRMQRSQQRMQHQVMLRLRQCQSCPLLVEEQFITYHPQLFATPAVGGTTTQTSSWLTRASAALFVPPSLTAAPTTSSASLTLREVAQLLASTKKDHIPEWNLSQYSGDPVPWHE